LAPNFNREYHSEDISDDDLEPVVAAPQPPKRRRGQRVQFAAAANNPPHHVVDIPTTPVAVAAGVGAGAAGKVSNIWSYIQNHKVIVIGIIIAVVIIVLVLLYFRPTNKQDVDETAGQQAAPPDQQTSVVTTPPQSQFGPRESKPQPHAPVQQPKARPVLEETAPEQTKPPRQVTAKPAAGKPSRLSAHDELTRTSDDATLQRFMNLEEKDTKAAAMTAKRNERNQPQVTIPADTDVESAFGLDDIAD